VAPRAVSRGLLAALVALLGAAGVVLALAEPDGDGPSSSRFDRWTPLRPATLERTEVAAARIGRFVYVVGGFERRTGVTTAAVERYDIRRDRWRRVRSMPLGLNHAAAVAYHSRLYVHGGYRGRRDLSSATPALLRYDPGRNRWRRLPSSPTPRAAHAAAVLGGRLYVAGGANAGGSLRSMEIYDFARRRWRRGPSFRGPARNHTTGTATGGYFYVLAGRDERNFRVAERYDPRRRRWQRLPSLRKARGGIASVPLRDGRVVVFGGEEAAGTIAEVELYDPRTRRWRPLPRMLTPRHGLGGVSLGGRVYALEGGPQPGFHFSSAVEALDVR
jgi:N-acetylneuraminic acid mutarotase